MVLRRLDSAIFQRLSFHFPSALFVVLYDGTRNGTSPNLYTVTRASHKTLGKERSTNTGDTEDKNDNHDSKKGSTTGNHFESIAGDHIAGDEGTSREVDHKSKAREQEPKEVPPRAKRPTAADWNEMNRNQRQHWRQRHK